MLTNKEAIEAHEALVTLIKNDKDEKYDIRRETRNVLADNLNLTIPVIEAFSATHNKLVQKYGKPNNKGEYEIKPGSDGEAPFKLERDGLLAGESDIESLHQIQLKSLPDNVAIDLLALMKRAGIVAY